MNIRLTTILFTLILLAGCTNDEAGKTEGADPPAVDLKTVLPGTWEKIGLVVDIQSFDNQDTSFTVELREEDWIRSTQSLPTRTYFDVNNNYRQVFRALNGDTISVSRGMWNTFSDTLLLVEPDTSYQFILTLNENGNLEFRRKIDWDGDGIEDDDYLERHRRISRTAE